MRALGLVHNPLAAIASIIGLVVIGLVVIGLVVIGSPASASTLAAASRALVRFGLGSALALAGFMFFFADVGDVERALDVPARLP